MKLDIAIIDAFTDRPFQGNPAATVWVEAFPSDRLMQCIAAEMNLSETAFACQLVPNRFHLRWFTPTCEVPLCGHATLAMAHYLRLRQAVDPNAMLVFATQSGDLAVSFQRDRIVLDFPTGYPFAPCDPATLTAIDRLLFEQNYAVLGIGLSYVTVRLASEAAVREFVPDFAGIAAIESALGLIVTAQADRDRPYDFVSRFFAPRAGIPEDPVTGSAHCILAPYWSDVLGKTELHARQLSARGGDLIVRAAGDRVYLAGQAIAVVQGTITLP